MDSKVYLVDQELNVTNYLLPQALILYQTAVINKDFPAAKAHFGALSEAYHNKIGKFLEHQGYPEE